MARVLVIILSGIFVTVIARKMLNFSPGLWRCSPVCLVLVEIWLIVI